MLYKYLIYLNIEKKKIFLVDNGKLTTTKLLVDNSENSALVGEVWVSNVFINQPMPYILFFNLISFSFVPTINVVSWCSKLSLNRPPSRFSIQVAMSVYSLLVTEILFHCEKRVCFELFKEKFFLMVKKKTFGTFFLVLKEFKKNRFISSLWHVWGFWFVLFILFQKIFFGVNF